MVSAVPLRVVRAGVAPGQVAEALCTSLGWTLGRSEWIVCGTGRIPYNLLSRAAARSEPSANTARKKGHKVNNAFQGLFVLAGIALIIVGFNGSRPLVIVGVGMIVLALLGRALGRKKH